MSGSRASNIADLGRMPIAALVQWMEQLTLRREEAQRTAALLRELRNRLGYLTAVGLGYLALDRAARTLSGGEAQRIHLASALGGRLSGTLYALDEPTVGLHARDSRRLLGVLRNLRDLGNTVIVVEHDPLMIREADYLVELGPGGGRDGGNLVYSGPPATKPRHAGDEPTARVLLMRAIARERRLAKSDPAVSIVRAAEHNLKECFRFHSARTHGLRDRSIGIGQIDPGRRSPVQQLPGQHRRAGERDRANASGSTDWRWSSASCIWDRSRWPAPRAPIPPPTSRFMTRFANCLRAPRKHGA